MFTQRAIQIASSLFLLLVAFFFIGLAYLMHSDESEFLSHAVKTTGEIESVTSFQQKKSSYFYPVVSFRTKDGKFISGTSETSSKNAEEYPVHSKRTVFYNSNNPEQFRLDSANNKDQYMFWGSLCIAGFCIAYSGIGLRKPAEKGSGKRKQK